MSAIIHTASAVTSARPIRPVVIPVIGDQLHLAESSIKTHVASIFLRLDTTNRVQAAIVAHQLGLV
ncbi:MULTISPECIES: LuxR C-terminal-related transcriptional regulator [unclassified Rhodococcus (in: high G+C Gram-positive bacteria)]|uniref:LuxR C-terminal-related transcriptional regulator n=1 Tax=unclassified Rhodococcus (in: high G+C Gram-positive bacteria) TaxID=192944 RepID=UPI001C9B8CD8|nr:MULTISPECIES: LuxR C-terminal-related transcriptional regulator [unclassified Rhodococcus (in: high G+C Gram-positive bacteria)]